MPIEDVRARTEGVASLLANYAATNATAEAISIAHGPEVEKAYHSGNFSKVVDEMRRHEITLQGGFAVALAERQRGSRISRARKPGGCLRRTDACDPRSAADRSSASGSDRQGATTW